MRRDSQVRFTRSRLTSARSNKHSDLNEMTSESESGLTLKARLAHELRIYAVISAYLFVCFAVILFYEASQSASKDVSILTLGVAAVKALVLGKFILIGEVFKPGTRLDAPTVLHRVAWRTLGMLIVLAIFKVLEELIVGLVHGKDFASIVSELTEMSWVSAVAPLLMMLLILIPLMIAIELNRVLGDDGLKGLLLGRE